MEEMQRSERIPAASTTEPAEADEVHGYVNGRDGGCIPPFGGMKFPFPGGTGPTFPTDPFPPTGGKGLPRGILA